MGVKKMCKSRKNVKGKVKRYRTILDTKYYRKNAKRDYNKAFCFNRPYEYHKTLNFSSISTQSKNSSDRREVYLFGWSLQGRSYHRTTIEKQG